MNDSTSTLPKPAGPAATELLDRARAGDVEAFGAVCREFEGRVLGQAILLCRDRSQAEDLAQETFVEAWKSLARYNGRCRFFTWLCAILIHRHRSQMRRRWPLPFSVLNRGDGAGVERRLADTAESAARPDESALRRDEASHLKACIQKLPLKQQQVVHLRFFADDSLEGIAEALGCSVGTVKSRLFHALERLRSMRAVRSLKNNDSFKP